MDGAQVRTGQKQKWFILGRCGMARLFALIRTIAFGLLIMAIVPAASPVSAQVNPNGSAVQEQKLLDQLKDRKSVV